jgi:WD40 repeat protein
MVLLGLSRPRRIRAVLLMCDLKTNQQVGDPLLHDDALLAIVLSSDGRYIASAGLDQKIYIWSLEAALKQASDQVRAHIANF